MKEYLVTITETLSRTIKVKAPTIGEAEEKVEQDYRHGKIVLDSGDYVTTQMTAVEYKED